MSHTEPTVAYTHKHTHTYALTHACMHACTHAHNQSKSQSHSQSSSVNSCHTHTVTPYFTITITITVARWLTVKVIVRDPWPLVVTLRITYRNHSEGFYRMLYSLTPTLTPLTFPPQMHYIFSFAVNKTFQSRTEKLSLGNDEGRRSNVFK